MPDDAAGDEVTRGFSGCRALYFLGPMAYGFRPSTARHPDASNTSRWRGDGPTRRSLGVSTVRRGQLQDAFVAQRLRILCNLFTTIVQLTC